MVGIFLNTPGAARVARSVVASQRFGIEAAGAVNRLLERCPRFRPTPLHCLDMAAAELGVGALWLKDERERLGLGSFKALGGAYAVLRLGVEAAAAKGGPTDMAALVAARHGNGLRGPLTVATATAGNHGRSVAAGAALVGARCVIFVYDGVPEDQIAAIARHGADIVRVAGVYEAAVAECRAQAAIEGWTIVSDTSWPGYDDIPARVMQGYTAMAAEAFDQVPVPPTHVLLQAGVGGMAASVAAHAAMRFGVARPRVVIVEPRTAACLLASARAGCLTDTPLGERTIMGRLECSMPSPIAWEIVAGLADAFVAVTDGAAARAVRWLGARGIETSPSGAAGVAGLLALIEHPSAVASLGLGRDSRVLAFVTEAATADDRARRVRSEWSEADAAMDEVP